MLILQTPFDEEEGGWKLYSCSDAQEKMRKPPKNCEIALQTPRTSCLPDFNSTKRPANETLLTLLVQKS